MTDKFVSANLHEGVAHENGRAYIQVNYVAATGSSLDFRRAGVKSLSGYGAALAEKERQAGATKAREKKGENSDF